MSKSACHSCLRERDAFKLTTCRMCDAPDEYCKSDKCAYNQEPCYRCGQEQPGCWACGGEGHLLKRNEPAFKCMICGEFEYCLKHLKKCACGQEHYFCNFCADNYRCQGKKCSLYFCPEKGQLLTDVKESTFCDAHVPRPFKRRLVDLINK